MKVHTDFDSPDPGRPIRDNGRPPNNGLPPNIDTRGMSVNEIAELRRQYLQQQIILTLGQNQRIPMQRSTACQRYPNLC